LNTKFKKLSKILALVLAISMITAACDKGEKVDSAASRDSISEVNEETAKAEGETTGENSATGIASSGKATDSYRVTTTGKQATTKHEVKQTTNQATTVKDQKPNTTTATKNQTATAAAKNKDLIALSSEELDRLLDEIYPGDSLTQEWIDRLPAEKIYEYFGLMYHDDFNGYIRKDGKAIDDSTVECTVIIRLLNGQTKKHIVKLKVNGNRWSVIEEKEVK